MHSNVILCHPTLNLGSGSFVLAHNAPAFLGAAHGRRKLVVSESCLDLECHVPLWFLVVNLVEQLEHCIEELLLLVPGLHSLLVGCCCCFNTATKVLKKYGVKGSSGPSLEA